MEIQIVSAIQEVATSSSLTIGLAVFFARYLIAIYALFGLHLLIEKRGERRHAVLEAAWAAALTLAVTAIIAALIGRSRPFQIPFDATSPVTLLIPPPLNSSFPSGHTGTSVAMAAAIFYAHRRLGYVAFVVAALVALGRIVVGVHYPSDIVGGILVGLFSFWIIRVIHRQIRMKDIERSARSHHHT